MSPKPTNREVIIVTQEFYPKRGGIATVTEEMAKAAVLAGYQVEVWAPSLKAGVEKQHPFAVRRLPVDSGHGPLNRFRLALEFRRSRDRLSRATVYLCEPGPMLAWMWADACGGIRAGRLALTFHGSEILRFHADWAVRAMTRRLVRQADRIGVLADYTRRLLAEHFPEAASRTVLTPGALRADFSAATSAARPEGKLVILTVGRLHPRKGQLCALRALGALPHELRDRIEYRLVGPAWSRACERGLREAAARSGVEVKFLGDLPDERLAEAYAGADIFALTSIDHGRSVEGFGLVYLEASACGLPVVAHRVGGVPEAVDEGSTGLLVEPGDREALTGAFRSLIEDSALRRRLGEAGPAWARRHSWTRAVELMFNDSSSPAA